jgi:hypothetical protein
MKLDWTAPRTLAAICTTVCLAQIAYFWSATAPWLARYAHDDAFYYLLVARHWARDGLPSFDGVEPTSGYQPLWQWLNVPLGLLADKVVQLRAMLSLEALAFHGGLLLAALALRRTTTPRAALLFLVLAEGSTAFSWGTVNGGMESGLLALLASWFVLAATKPASGAKDALVFGLIGGLLATTRIDFLAFGPFLLWFVLRRRGKVADAALAAIPLVALVLLAAAINWSTTGHPLPVSGSVKLHDESSYFTTHGIDSAGRLKIGLANLARLSYRGAGEAFGGSALFAARAAGLAERWFTHGSALAAAAILALSLRKLASARLRPLHLAVAALVPVVLIRLAFYTWAYPLFLMEYRWYYTVELILLLYALAVALDAASAALRRGVMALLVVLAPLGVWGFLAAPGNYQHVAGAWELAEYVESRPDLRAADFGGWDSGLLAFVLPNRVTNLDGLVNSRTYFDQVLRGGRPLGTYLEERGIRFVANFFDDPALDLSAGLRNLPAESYAVEWVATPRPLPFSGVRRWLVLRVLP